MRLTLICWALVFALAARGGVLNPEYEIQFSDVSQIKRALNENSWANEMAQSNLYRGAMVKLGPVLFALATESEDSWKGRLLDFFYDKILEGKRLGVSYFHQAGLVSPFGATVFNLSGADKTVLSVFIEKHKLAKAQIVEIETGGPKPARVEVHPVAVRLQKFALVLGESCFSVSRDPKVAAHLGERCTRATQKKSDVTVTVDLKEFFPAWYPVLDRLAGIGRHAEMAFDYDKRQANFVPAKVEVPLRPTHILGQGKMGPDLLAAIPADTLLQVTAFVPDPGNLSPTTVETYFQSKKAAPPVPITLLYFGMRPGLNSKPESMSALLLPQKEINDGLFAAVNQLFDENSRYEVKYAKVCDRYLALSPSKVALDKITHTCGKKEPSYAQMPQFIVKALSDQPLSTSTVVNLGGFLKSTIAFAWATENAPSTDGKKDPKEVPKEIAQAMDLLGRLPLYAFAGKAEKEKLSLNGVKP